MPGTIATPDVETTRDEELTPLYNVVLLDDDEHTYDYVIELTRRYGKYPLDLGEFDENVC